MILRDFEGLTTEEASTRLKVKDQTLKSRLHRGRLLLRERLQAFASVSHCIGRRRRIRDERQLLFRSGSGGWELGPALGVTA